MDREASLRPEYAEWYPVLCPGEWIRARYAHRLVELQLVSGTPKWEAGGRILSPDHFLFRGGEGTETFEGSDRRHSAGDPLPPIRES